MKYILPVILLIGLVSLIVFSGCVSNKDTTEDLTSGITSADNQNKSLDNTDKQISDDLSALNTDEVTTSDPEVQAIDSDLKELDNLLNEEDPLAGLN